VQDNAANAIAANTKFQFQSWFLQAGRAKMEQWNGISGTGIQTLYDDPKWIENSAADAVRYVAGMTTGGENGNATFNESWGDNYGARVSAYLIPSESGDYNFFLRSDDSSQLYLSQNETFPIPGTDSPICEETGCCSAFLEPGDVIKPANTTAIPITLTAGKKYAIMAMMKEGGGGDGVSVAWRKVGDTTTASSLPDLLANIFWYGGAVATNILTVNDTVVASSANSPKDRDENAPNVLDGNSSTKYLNLDILNTGFTVTPKLGATVIIGISLTTANDAPDRDPASYRVEGSMDGTNFTVIAESLVPAAATRFFKRTYTFANTIPHTVYRVTFPTVVNAIQAMQIADVELLGNVFGGMVETPNKQPFSDGLVAYYPFNGNANDESGNASKGTVNGATLTSDRFGRTNSAYYFDGSSTYITTPLPSSVFEGDFTVSVWLNASDISNGWPSLLHEQNNSFLLQIAGDNSLSGREGKMIAYSQTAAGGRGWFLQRQERTPINTFSQVVITKVGASIKMYWNGQTIVPQEVTNPTIQTGQYIAGQYLTIGRMDFATVPADSTFHGAIDDVRIYSRSLSAQEVTDLYSFESAVPPTNTAPKLTVAATATIPEMQTWTLQATATDEDIPAQKLVFGLELAPAGMTIDSATGLIQWTPTVAQGPGNYTVIVKVTDDGQPSQTTQQAVQITVNEVNNGPFNDGLVAYYPFNGNANDESGYGNIGTASGATLIADRFGLAKSAYYFNSNLLSSITAPGKALPTGSATRTFCFWVKPDAKYPQTNYLTSTVFSYGEYTNGLQIYLNYERLIPNLLTLRMHFFTSAGVSRWVCWYSGWDFNKWHHIIFTVTNIGDVQCFVDGSPQGVEPPDIDLGFNVTPSAIHIGQCEFLSNQYDGAIDDVRIYNRSLSPSESQAVYVYESTPAITLQPTNVIAALSSVVSMNIAATNGNNATLSFQWFKDNNRLSWATNSSLVLSNLHPVNVGDYYAVVGNGFMSVTSSVANVSVPGVNQGLWKGLVGYYPFNGNANDESGNGISGTNNGVSWGVDRFGIAQRCAAFAEGSAMRITASGIVLPVATSDRTISLWYLPVVPTELNGTKYTLLSYGDNGNSGISEQGKQLWITLFNKQLVFETPYNGYRWYGDRTKPIWKQIVLPTKKLWMFYDRN
jgi:hypothetical protein